MTRPTGVKMLCDCCCDCIVLSGYECDCEENCWYWKGHL